MIGWLYRLIVGRFTSCTHSWETIADHLLDDQKNDHTGVLYVLRCKHCGEITQRKVKP